MWSALGAVWIAVLILGVFGLAALVLVLRYGPRRGTWNQPAAALRPPGRRMGVVLYAMAALHLAAGLAAIAAPGVGASVLLVAAAMALFYVGCAHVMAIAQRTEARAVSRPARDPKH